MSLGGHIGRPVVILLAGTSVVRFVQAFGGPLGASGRGLGGRRRGDEKGEDNARRDVQTCQSQADAKGDVRGVRGSVLGREEESNGTSSSGERSQCWLRRLRGIRVHSAQLPRVSAQRRMQEKTTDVGVLREPAHVAREEKKGTLKYMPCT